MRLARVLGAIGRGLISAGVIVLLFVAYQLWGTGLQHSAAQNNLGDEFVEQTGIDVGSDAESLAELAAASQNAIEDGVILASDPEAVLVVDEDESATADETEEEPGPAEPTPNAAELFEANFDEEARQEILAKLYPEPGEAFARIVIPAINVDQISVEGVSVEDLRKGPGHYRTTPNPGQAGNAAIAGHRTTYGAPFHRVDELNPDDSIFVTTAQGTFHYKVLGFDEAGNEGGDLGYFIVNPSQTEVLDQGSRNLLTLTACHPKYSARQRIIVQAELVGEPAPTIPREEAVEIGAISLDSGSADERANAANAIEGEDQIISDAVAADDDPSVDADGNPIEDAEQSDENDEEATEVAEEVTEETDEEEVEEDQDTDDTAVAAGTDTGPDDEDSAVNVAVSAESVSVDTSTDAELTAAEGPLGDPNDFGEGLNGDPTKVRPAILWGVSGLFIWVAAWFSGKRFERKWTLYALAAAPFVLVLWSTFVNVDQALPSY